MKILNLIQSQETRMEFDTVFSIHSLTHGTITLDAHKRIKRSWGDIKINPIPSQKSA